MGMDMYLYKGIETRDEGIAMEEVMYWRKAYQVHDSIQANSGYHIENGAIYPIWSLQLKKVLKECKELLEKPSQLEYPGTEWELDWVKKTVEVLEKLDLDNLVMYYYTANW